MLVLRLRVVLLHLAGVLSDDPCQELLSRASPSLVPWSSKSPPANHHIIASSLFITLPNNSILPVAVTFQQRVWNNNLFVNVKKIVI